MDFDEVVDYLGVDAEELWEQFPFPTWDRKMVDIAERYFAS